MKNCGLVEPGLLRWAACCHFIFIFLALIALPLEAPRSQPAERAPDTMAARVLACASCHGAEGEGTSDVYFPRLAGKPAGYLYNQLVAFRDGRRKYPPMNYLLEFLPDAYLKKIAEHFASLRPPFPAPAVPTVSNEILTRGESLVKNGDPQHGIPPCSACHRPDISATAGLWICVPLPPAARVCWQFAASLRTKADVKPVAPFLSSRRAPAD